MSHRSIRIDLGKQTLELRDGERTIAVFSVSTAKNGPGERNGSECTPRGRHRICEKIGHSLPEGAVLVSREPTGEICTPETYRSCPGRDWILTRILWLDGVEPGRNHGGDVDSRSRYIYIHGAPDDVPMGVPGSHGCVRMRNADVCALFDLVDEGTLVDIVE
jgi:lipoprotein-anchoring transpeptidase ErfK/SrfK